MFDGSQSPMSRRTACAIVSATVLLLVASVLAGRRLEPLGPSAAQAQAGRDAVDRSDTRFYREVVTRVRGGQPYYEAVRDEFRLPIWSPTGFHPTSVFNWRLPVYAWVLAALPGAGAAKMLLGLLAGAAALGAFAAIRQRCGGTAGSLTVLVVGPLLWCVIGEVFYFAEAWAGVLVACSLSAYGVRRWQFGVAAGLAALMFRELAVVYCGMMCCVAIARRRGFEVGAWMAGFAAFGLLFAYHVAMVSRYMSPAHTFAIGSWLRFSGLPFLLRAVQVTNAFLILFPAWVTALYVSAAFGGLAGWRDDMGRRIFATVLAYSALLAALGAPGTPYWGLMFAPLLALGIAVLPATARQVYAALAPPRGRIPDCVARPDAPVRR